MSGAIARLTRNVREFLVPSTAENRSVPVLDGGLSPNDDLDSLIEVWSQPMGEPDSLLVTPKGMIVGSGSSLTLLAPDGSERGPALDLAHPIGALALLPDGRVFVATVGGPSGYAAWGGSGELQFAHEQTLTFGCPTDAVVLGRNVYVTEGSATHRPEEWMFDLMEKGATGRVVSFDLDYGQLRTVVSKHAWPSGVEVSTKGNHVVVSEAWRHRLVEVDVASAMLTPLGPVLPAYPGRLSRTRAGALLVAFPFIRSHLVEFVLREDEYRRRMIDSIHPDYWVRPAFRATAEPWEPLQIGSMKHLGVTKPWAPARAYGLVALLNADGTPRRSWHGRVGSPRTGVTAAVADGGHLMVLCRGARQLLRSNDEELT